MRTHSQRGLTLVELLIALALLGFVLLGITPLFMASVKSNYAGNEYTSIHVLARDRLEQLMNLPFDDDQLIPGVHGNDLPPTLPTGAPNPFRLSYEVFQYQIPSGDTVTVPDGASFTDKTKLIIDAGQQFQYKRIDVTVVSTSGQIGIGTRQAMVSGLLANPFPDTNFSVVPVTAVPTPSVTP